MPKQQKKAFTDKYLQSLKPMPVDNPKPYYKREGRGFAVRVLPSGLRTFFFIYTLGGKRKYLKLGAYGPEPLTTLAAARIKYQAAYNSHEAGIDIAAPLLNPIQNDESVLFKEFCQDYLNYSQAHHTEYYYRTNKNCLAKDAIPYWGDKPITEIHRRDAIILLERVAERATGQAKNVQAALRGVFDYALQREYIEFNPMLRLNKVVPSLKYIPRNRVLTEAEIWHVWNALKDYPAHRALKLILVTAQRPGECAGIVRSEITDSIWTIPAARAEKGKRDHIVPLTEIALELIGEGTSERVFDVHRSSLSQTVSRVLKFCGLPRWTPHDLRRTARTFMAQLGVPEEHSEAVLNHAKQGMQRVYNKYEYQAEKQAALLKWENELLRIVSQPTPETLPETDTVAVIDPLADFTPPLYKQTCPLS